MSRGRWEGFALACAGIALVLVLALAVARVWPGTFLPVELSVAERIDAVAQNSMAAAAWAMFAVTSISAGLGVLSVWLIWLNLVEARNLARDGATSAKAAEEAVREAQSTSLNAWKIGTAQTRAYITVTQVTAEYDSEAVHITASYENAGQSPARRVRAVFRVKVWNHGPANVVHESTRTVFLPDTPMAKSSTAAVSIDDFRNTAEVNQAIQHAAGQIEIEGEFIHKDVFDKPQDDDFAFYGKGRPITPANVSRSFQRTPQPSSSR